MITDYEKTHVLIGKEGKQTSGKIISAPWGVRIGATVTIEAQDENGNKFKKTGYISEILY